MGAVALPISDLGGMDCLIWGSSVMMDSLGFGKNLADDTFLRLNRVRRKPTK
jgi:hypothetical protein